MVEEERILCHKEIQRLESEVQSIREQNETTLFMIKNKLHVLAQYIRVKVPLCPFRISPLKKFFKKSSKG
jgi:hypothetical protein